MFFEIFMAFVVIPTDGRLFDGPVHSFNLTVRPGVFYLGQPVLDAI